MHTTKVLVGAGRFLLALVALGGWPSVCVAQLQSLSGALVVNAGFGLSGTDIDVDPVNRVYLIVGTGLQGTFRDLAGGDIGISFGISTTSGLRGFPRVRYSADVNGGTGGFLVTWYQSIGTTTSYALHARLVAYPTGAIGADTELAADTGAHAIASADGTGQAVSYSRTSRAFLVTWQQRTSAGDDTMILGRRVGVDGTPIGSVISIAANNGCFGRFKAPGVSWNPTTDDFGVSFSGEDLTTGGGEAHFATVNPAGAVTWPTACSHSSNLLQDISATDVDFNPRTGHWMMAWLASDRASPAVPHAYASEVSAAGTFLKVTHVSTALTGGRLSGGIDGITLSYNPVSGTFLLADIDRLAPFPGPHCSGQAGILGIELDAHGVRLGSEVRLNQPLDVCEAYYPRAIAVPGLGRWAISFGETRINAFPLMRLQLVGTSTPLPLTMNVVAVGDMNGDSHPDLVRRSVADGINGVTLLDTATPLATIQLPTVAAGPWHIVGAADFNRDRWPDLLWRDEASGSNVLWYMSSTSIVSTAFLPTVPGPWQIAGMADFNGDGWPDLLWRHPVTGINQLWFLMNNAVIGAAFLPSVVSTSWVIAGVADLNGDRNPDVLWRNPSTGANQIWYLSGVSIAWTAFLPSVPGADWVVVGLTDINGDGQVDVLWRNTETDEVSVWYLNGTTIIGSAFIAAG